VHSIAPLILISESNSDNNKIKIERTGASRPEGEAGLCPEAGHLPRISGQMMPIAGIWPSKTAEPAAETVSPDAFDGIFSKSPEGISRWNHLRSQSPEMPVFPRIRGA